MRDSQSRAMMPSEFEVYISFIIHNGKPALLIRRIIHDRELIKYFSFLALNRQVIPVRVSFANKNSEIETLRRLKELGFI